MYTYEHNVEEIVKGNPLFETTLKQPPPSNKNPFYPVFLSKLKVFFSFFKGENFLLSFSFNFKFHLEKKIFIYNKIEENLKKYIYLQ